MTKEIIHDANDVAISGDIPSHLPDIIEAMDSDSEILVKDLDGVHRFHRFHIHSDGLGLRTSFDD